MILFWIISYLRLDCWIIYEWKQREIQRTYMINTWICNYLTHYFSKHCLQYAHSYDHSYHVTNSCLIDLRKSLCISFWTLIIEKILSLYIRERSSTISHFKHSFFFLILKFVNFMQDSRIYNQSNYKNYPCLKLSFFHFLTFYITNQILSNPNLLTTWKPLESILRSQIQHFEKAWNIKTEKCEHLKFKSYSCL